MGNDMKSPMKFLLKNTSLVFVMKIFGMGFAFIFQIILGRLLGKSLYGEYTVFISIVNIFSLVTLLGTDNCLIRTIPHFNDDDKFKYVLLKRVLTFVTINSVFITLLMFIFRHRLYVIFDIADKKYLVLTFLILIVFSMSKVIDGFLQGIKKTTISILFNTALNNLFRIIFFFVLYFVCSKKILVALAGYLLTEIVLLALRLIYIFKEYSKEDLELQTEYELKDYKYFIRYSLSLFIIVGIDILMRNIDKLMIQSYVGYGQVGIYKATENYLALVAVFITPFVVFWPMISEMYKKKQIKLIDEMFSNIVKIVSLFSLPVIIFMIVFSKDLLLFFGEEYIVGYSVLYILLIGNVFDALAGPVGALLNMTEYAKYNLVNMIGLLILNVILNFILIPRYGINGAAMATTISLVVINSVNIVQNKILLNVFPYSKENIYLLIFSVAVFFVDKNLYNIVNINIFIKMILFILMNYVILISLYILIIRPNIKEMYEKLVKKNV